MRACKTHKPAQLSLFVGIVISNADRATVAEDGGTEGQKKLGAFGLFLFNDDDENDGPEFVSWGDVPLVSGTAAHVSEKIAVLFDDSKRILQNVNDKLAECNLDLLGDAKGVTIKKLVGVMTDHAANERATGRKIQQMVAEVAGPHCQASTVTLFYCARHKAALMCGEATCAIAAVTKATIAKELDDTFRSVVPDWDELSVDAKQYAREEHGGEPATFSYEKAQDDPFNLAHQVECGFATVGEGGKAYHLGYGVDKFRAWCDKEGWGGRYIAHIGRILGNREDKVFEYAVGITYNFPLYVGFISALMRGDDKPNLLVKKLYQQLNSGAMFNAVLVQSLLFLRVLWPLRVACLTKPADCGVGVLDLPAVFRATKSHLQKAVQNADYLFTLAVDHSYFGGEIDGVLFDAYFNRAQRLFKKTHNGTAVDLAAHAIAECIEVIVNSI